jgi:GAF domain
MISAGRPARNMGRAEVGATLEADIVKTTLATPVRKGEGATGRIAELHEPNQVPDILLSPGESRVRGALVRAGYRALLAVPLVREDHLLGGLTVVRKMPGVPERRGLSRRLLNLAECGGRSDRDCTCSRPDWRSNP